MMVARSHSLGQFFPELRLSIFLSIHSPCKGAGLQQLNLLLSVHLILSLVFLISFLGMGISYELHYMDHILEKIQKERITKEHWNMSKEVEQYLKYREIKDLVDEVIGG